MQIEKSTKDKLLELTDSIPGLTKPCPCLCHKRGNSFEALRYGPACEIECEPDCTNTLPLEPKLAAWVLMEWAKATMTVWFVQGWVAEWKGTDGPVKASEHPWDAVISAAWNWWREQGND